MNHSNISRSVAAALMIGLVVTVSGVSLARQGSKSSGNSDAVRPADVAAIKATIEAYRKAWLANDSKAVLATFTDDAVLLPAHGSPPVVGISAIEKYWFAPGGPPTTVTGLDITVEQVDGNQTLAFARGEDKVSWTVTQNGQTRRHFHPGTYLNVMKKLPDGSWRIQAHMWDDGPERID